MEGQGLMYEDDGLAAAGDAAFPDPHEAVPPPETPGARSVALAAFDRSLDEADPARTDEDTGSSPPVALRAGGAGAAALRSLRFTAAEFALDVRITCGTGRRDVAGVVEGRCAGAPATSVELRRVDGASTHPIDSQGGFAVDGLAPGPVSIVVRRTGRAPVVTDWFVI